MFKRLCCFLLLFTLWPAYASDTNHELADAREVFLRAVDGDKPAVREATRRFRTLSQGHPQEPVFLAYLGACTTLQGRDAANNIERRRLTEDGLRQVDRAVELLHAGADHDPAGYLDTLLVAANSYIHVPSFFNRYDEGRRLLQEILAHSGFDGEATAGGFRAAVYMAAALVARGDRDEAGYRRYLELSVGADPEGRDGRFASRLLQEG